MDESHRYNIEQKTPGAADYILYYSFQIELKNVQNSQMMIDIKTIVTADWG